MYTSSYQLATDTHRSPNTLAPPHRAAAELKHNNYNHIHVHNLHVSVDFAAHFPGTKKNVTIQTAYRCVVQELLLLL